MLISRCGRNALFKMWKNILFKILHLTLRIHLAEKCLSCFWSGCHLKVLVSITNTRKNDIRDIDSIADFLTFLLSKFLFFLFPDFLTFNVTPIYDIIWFWCYWHQPAEAVVGEEAVGENRRWNLAMRKRWEWCREIWWELQKIRWEWQEVKWEWRQYLLTASLACWPQGRLWGGIPVSG